VTDLLAAIFVAYNCEINTLASFNIRRRMKAETRQIPQKLAARLKFVYWNEMVNHSFFGYEPQIGSNISTSLPD